MVVEYGPPASAVGLPLRGTGREGGADAKAATALGLGLPGRNLAGPPKRPWRRNFYQSAERSPVPLLPAVI